eukprot:1161835-Pelagomonas_calceolata.AAC.2
MACGGWPSHCNHHGGVQAVQGGRGARAGGRAAAGGAAERAQAATAAVSHGSSLSGQWSYCLCASPSLLSGVANRGSVSERREALGWALLTWADSQERL